jgi:hypothetical protein
LPLQGYCQYVRQTMRWWVLGFTFAIAASCIALTVACAKRGTERVRATEFLDRRRIKLPTSATDVAFSVNDQLRSVAYFIRLDLPAAAALSFQSQLWCEPKSGTGKPHARPPSFAPWFTVASLTDVKRCDTNGPYDGQYHLDATVGRAPTGQTRFLLSFSD